MKQKVIALLCAGILVLAGCGGGDAGNTGTAATGQTQSADTQGGSNDKISGFFFSPGGSAGSWI